jgi:hypothetical protein
MAAAICCGIRAKDSWTELISEATRERESLG